MLNCVALFFDTRRLNLTLSVLQLRTVLIVGGTIFSVSVVIQMFYSTTSWAVNITAYQAKNMAPMLRSGSHRSLFSELWVLLQAFKWGAITGITTGGVLALSAANIRRL